MWSGFDAGPFAVHMDVGPSESASQVYADAEEPAHPVAFAVPKAPRLSSKLSAARAAAIGAAGSEAAASGPTASALARVQAHLNIADEEMTE